MRTMTGATVVLHEGTHGPLLLDPALDSGSSKFPIRYMAAGGARPVISAGMPVPTSAWRPAAPGSSILKANLSAATGVTEFGSLPVHGSDQEGCDQLVYKKTELFHHSAEMVLARYPNVDAQGRWKFLNADVNGGRADGFAFSGCAYASHECNHTEAERVRNWAARPDARVHGYWVRDWADSIQRVVAVNVSNGTAVVTLPSTMHGDFRHHNNRVDSSARFFGLNILSELDSPSEYYIDEDGMAYYWPAVPKERWTEAPVISVADVAVMLDGTSHITLEGLTIAHARTIGVSATNVSEVVIRNSTIWGCGAKGVVIDDAQDSGMVGCHIFSTGCGGAVVSGGNFTTLKPGNNYALNNRIHDMANYKRSYQPGLLWAGVNNSYSWNHISDGPHNCILGGGNQVRGNEADLLSFAVFTHSGGLARGQGPTTCSSSMCWNAVRLSLQVRLACVHRNRTALLHTVLHRTRTVQRCQLNSTNRSDCVFACVRAADSGAFYTCGQQANAFVNRGNIFRHSTFKDIRNTGTGGCQGSSMPVSGLCES